MDIRCTQCSANVSVLPDARLIRCTYCEASLVVDSGAALFNEVVLPTVPPEQAAAHLRRFLAGDLTVSGLDREATVAAPSLEYFPFWAFSYRGVSGETTSLEPAAPTSLQGLQGLSLPTGETRPMSKEITGAAPVTDPEVPLATAQGWLKNKYGDAPITRSVLYHVPLYRVSYTWRGRVWQAAVDGVTGRVFPAAYPVKAEQPYLAVLLLALFLFGIEGCAVVNLPLKAALYLVTAVPLLVLSWWVIRKT